MPRLIDADALTSILEEWEEKACDGTENDGSDGTTRVLYYVPTTTAEMIDLIAAQPTIEAEPVKRGRWERSGALLECQCCGEIYSQLGGNAGKSWNYCPNCGAKMQGVKDE